MIQEKKKKNGAKITERWNDYKDGEMQNYNKQHRCFAPLWRRRVWGLSHIRPRDLWSTKSTVSSLCPVFLHWLLSGWCSYWIVMPSNSCNRHTHTQGCLQCTPYRIHCTPFSTPPPSNCMWQIQQVNTFQHVSTLLREGFIFPARHHNTVSHDSLLSVVGFSWVSDFFFFFKSEHNVGNHPVSLQLHNPCSITLVHRCQL